MKEVKKEQFEAILEKISNNESLIEKLVIYLEKNNLMEDFLKKIYYTIEKDGPIYKIRYYKDKHGKLLGLYDVKNSDDLINTLEKYSVYVYDEIKTLFFEEYEINQKITRQQQYSKRYNNLAIKLLPLSSCENLGNRNLVNFIKLNPLLFIYTLASYSVDMDELNQIETKSYTYKKEIKNN